MKLAASVDSLSYTMSTESYEWDRYSVIYNSGRKFQIVNFSKSDHDPFTI